MSSAALLVGVGADLAFGDPRRWHPVAGFGRLAVALERPLYAPSRARGAAFTAALVASSALAAELLARRLPRPAVLAACLWAALGGRSLWTEAAGLERALRTGQLDDARCRLPALCGRDPEDLDAAGLARATIESLAENTSDAVVAPLLWAAVAGPAGVAGYRAANTLDAMVGHRSTRYQRFGWAAARLDDALNWPAARLAAVLACLAAPLVGGSPVNAWRTVRRDGAAHPSPNAGRIEAAFAGALGVSLGGPLSYAGRVEERSALGDGRPAGPDDITRATRLSVAVTLAATGALALGGRR